MGIRVFASVSSRSPLFPIAWEDPQSVVQDALKLVIQQGLNPANTSSRLLAVERWSRVHIVFDLGHDDYKPEAAHLLGQNDLPVLAVDFSRDGTNTARAASTGLQDEVNKQIREIHDLTGFGSQPPFFIDHANGSVPTFPHPRTMKKA